MRPDPPSPSSGPCPNKPRGHEAAKSPELSYAGDCGAWVVSSPDMGMMLVRRMYACSPCEYAWATQRMRHVVGQDEGCDWPTSRQETTTMHWEVETQVTLATAIQ